jgi:hypothetical protein
VKWVWTWSGRCFGYWEADDLWTYLGKHVGRRSGTDVFAPSGRYMGEITANGRLTVNKAKVAQHGSSFVPFAHRAISKSEPAAHALPVYLGYEDFPDPDRF